MRRRRSGAAAMTMRAAVAALAVAVAPCEARAGPAIAEISGSVSLEGRGFPRPPRFAGQRRHSASVAFESELYLEWDDLTSLTATPFLRVDSADPERTHGDLREFWLRVVRDDWELGAGVGKLFWGVAESFHLVDIVNQTDLVEDIDLEEKLGQPMAVLTLVRDWGYIDAIVMPWFRERSFPGPRGRLRSEPAVAGDGAEYGSAAGRRHVDAALRYSGSFGGWDVGVYGFRGVSRDPSFRLRADRHGAAGLTPFYGIVEQAATDIQYTAGAWLWKAEALYRRGRRDVPGAKRTYAAYVAGFEWTLYDPFGDGADVGLLVEHLRDSRGAAAASPFQNDVFAAARLTLNDAADTSALVGVIHDLSHGARLFTLEAGRRVSDELTLTAQARLFEGAPAGAPLWSFRDDDMAQLSLTWRF